MDEPHKIYYASKHSVWIPVDSKFPAKPARQNQPNGEIGSTQALINGEECKFHYFHFLLKVGTYCGMIPLQLSFNQESKHYQLSKINIFLRVCIYLQPVFSPKFEHAFFHFSLQIVSTGLDSGLCI